MTPPIILFLGSDLNCCVGLFHFLSFKYWDCEPFLNVLLRWNCKMHVLQEIWNSFCSRFSWFLMKYILHKKMKFSIKDFFSKCGQIRRKHLLNLEHFITFTEEILNGKLNFLCSNSWSLYSVRIWEEVCYIKSLLQ